MIIWIAVLIGSACLLILICCCTHANSWLLGILSRVGHLLLWILLKAHPHLLCGLRDLWRSEIDVVLTSSYLVCVNYVSEVFVKFLQSVHCQNSRSLRRARFKKSYRNGVLQLERTDFLLLLFLIVLHLLALSYASCRCEASALHTRVRHLCKV